MTLSTRLLSADDLAVPVAKVALDGNCVFANKQLCDFLGYSHQDLENASFHHFFEPNEPQTQRAEHAQLLAGTRRSYAAFGHAICRDGRQLPVRVLFSSVWKSDSEQPSHILAVMEDGNALKAAQTALLQSEAARHELARRLTNAQENERTRIARELHDDIGQSLAILRIQFLRAGQPVSGLPGKKHPGVAKLCNDLRDVAGKVSRLSHQLHSSELEYLGLTTAVQSHCREFSEKYKIPVQCDCRDVPKDLDGLLALSFLRVVQEALHNAAKHSSAKGIKVSLRANPNELLLSIADDGIGFDPEEVRLAAGLGLISMRERIHLAGGEFSLESKPGMGTRISARVPLNPEQDSAKT